MDKSWSGRKKAGMFGHLLNLEKRKRCEGGSKSYQLSRKICDLNVSSCHCLEEVA